LNILDRLAKLVAIGGKREIKEKDGTKEEFKCIDGSV